MKRNRIVSCRAGAEVLSSLLLGCGLVLSGCSDPPVTTAPQPVPAARAAKPAPAASSAEVNQPPKMELRDEDFVETERSRDPFRTYADLFVTRSSEGVRVQRTVLIEEFSVDELRLVGVITRINPAKAMLVDPRGYGHVVHRGDFVGRAERVQSTSTDTEFTLNWRIERIRDADIVLVREDPSNPDLPSATRVIALRPEESG